MVVAMSGEQDALRITSMTPARTSRTIVMGFLFGLLDVGLVSSIGFPFHKEPRATLGQTHQENPLCGVGVFPHSSWSATVGRLLVAQLLSHCSTASTRRLVC